MSTMVITEEMVIAKENENSARRVELMKQQKDLPASLEPEPNFPPECCCIKPLIYHNIREQVPVPQQRFMYCLCGLYLVLLVLIVYNVVAALIGFILAGTILQFGLSFIYLLGLPGAWIVWYYNVYSTVVKLSRIRQIFALLGLALAVGFDAWMAIGVNGLGGCGWIITFLSLKNTPVFIVFLIAAILWTLHGIAMFVMLVMFWRASNLNLSKRKDAVPMNIHVNVM